MVGDARHRVRRVKGLGLIKKWRHRRSAPLQKAKELQKNRMSAPIKNVENPYFGVLNNPL
jgi:hypothetical protein